MDTVVLYVPKDYYRIQYPERFTDKFEPINFNDAEERITFLTIHKGRRKYTYNPPSELRDRGIVYPNLHIYERLARSNYTCNLYISFSCPKILWAHSFEEVFNLHFDLIIDTLHERLIGMGIILSKEVLINAVVQTLHYCANILFQSEEEARIFLNRLSKVSLGGWFENNTKTFSNNGNAVRFHTNIFEIVFYLKYYDVLETAKTRVDRHVTLQEKETASRLLKEKNIPPVVRMEIRFNGTRSIRSHLRTALGIDKQYWAFREIFDSAQSRKVLMYYWNIIIQDPLNRLILAETSDSDICNKVLKEYGRSKMIEISESLGLFYMLKSLGVKRLRQVLAVKQTRKTWYDKRKKLIVFARRFVDLDESLIKLVTEVLENKPRQLGLPL